MPKWTDKQLDAINHSCKENAAAIVSAAAGSGKTAVLVERIIKMVSDEDNKIPADRIAAVTFTVKAADELKSRLETALSAQIATTGSKWLEEQLIRMEDAKIATINSFCIDIVRPYADLFDFQSDFRIIDEREADSLSDKALKDTLEELHENEFSDYERLSLSEVFEKAGDSEIEKAITSLSIFLEKEPNAQEWLDEKSNYFSDLSFFNRFLVEPLIKKIKEKIKECLEFVENSLSIAFSPTVLELVNADKNLILKWSEANLLDPNEVDPLLPLRAGSSAYGKGKESPDIKKILKENYNHYKPLIKEISEQASLVISFKTAVNKQKGAVQTLIKLYKIYRNNFMQRKIEAGGLDFNDTEHFCLSLLKDFGSEVADEIRNNFDEIIVDEFQDCNRLQCEIFKLLSKEEKNLFFVGDVKQLIYRFRNADPAVFIGTMKDEKFKPLLLNKNFRSNHEVINSVNDLFHGLMTEELGGVVYDKDARLECGSNIQGGELYNTEICITDDGNEPIYIASRINEMVGNFEIFDKHKKIMRKLEYGDIAIIMSALYRIEEEYISAFELYNIPYARGGKGDFTSLNEISIAIDFLKIIENPYRDMEMLKVLMSPLFRFKPDEIASVRLLGDKSGSLYSDLIKSAESGIKYSEDIINSIAKYKAVSENNTVAKLIRIIFEDGIFEPLIARSRNAEKTIANLRLLQIYSEKYLEYCGGTLTGFLRFLSDIKDRKRIIGEVDAVSETANGKVQLLTIHGSKGLEFPVCFIARTNKPFIKKETHPNLILDKEIGFAFKYIDNLIRYKTLTHESAVQNIEKALRSEELRKLYVAVTRARDKLIITAELKKDKEPPEDCYLNWILNSKAIGKSIYLKYIESEDIRTFEESQAGSINSEIDILIDESALKKSILSSINMKYPYEILTKIPKKLTATQIGVLRSKFLDTDDEPNIFPRNPSFIKNDKLTGKKRGDAYHLMMELIDFKKGNYEKQISELSDYFTKSEYAAVQSSHIINFFSSNLGKRATASQRVEKEFPLYTELSNLIEIGLSDEINQHFHERPFIQGIADMFFYENGKIVLVDYKTNRNTSENRLKLEYKKQLQIYKKAIEEMTGIEVCECYIYSFEVGEVLVD